MGMIVPILGIFTLIWRDSKKNGAIGAYFGAIGAIPLIFGAIGAII